MVKIQQDKNGNGYFYLVKYYNCLSEKHGEKKNSLVNLGIGRDFDIFPKIAVKFPTWAEMWGQI